MRVEKIELIGFKSFAEKTVFDLHKGITCIVGPNGCGKSNVVDSFRWVLGEQSAKSLRGDKMMEVIFDGSQSKKPRGMAEVNLYMSGMSGEAPENGTAVITRRLYRSGESDYMINRSSCRLKDIKDLFLDTGLELKNYSIFEQDNISKIINSKPEDRRFLIEEVAGVVKYRVRRAEAEGKLESSRLNLQRLSDIVGEVKRQINSLDRQAKKAARYKRLLEELKDLELKQARATHLELTSHLGETEGTLTVLREKDASMRAGVAELENRHSEKRLMLAERQKEQNILQEALQGLERSIAQKERDIAVLEAEIDSLGQRTTRLEHEEKEILERMESSELRHAGLSAERDGLLASISALEAALMDKEAALNETRRQAEGLEGRLEEARRELFRATGELSSIVAELGKTESLLSGLERKGESLAKEMETEDALLSQKEAALGGLQSKEAERKEEFYRLRQETEGLAAELAALQERAGGLRESTAAKKEALASVVSREESLREILFDPATKELLGREELHIRQSLSDIIEAHPEYEQAIEAALRELAGGFIVEGRDEAVKALKVIRGKDIGKTAFIPLALKTLREGELPSPPAWSLGRAVDFLKVVPPYENLVRTLLEDIFIVRELSDVPPDGLPGDGSNGRIIASLSGEVVDSKGVFTGGQDRGLLAKKRALRELEKERQSLKDSIAGEEKQAEGLNALILEQTQALQALRDRCHELETELSLTRQAIEGLLEETERIRKKTSYLRLEEEALKTESSALGEALTAKLGQKEGLEKARLFQELKIKELQERLAALKGSFEEQQAAFVEGRMELSGLRQTAQGLEKEMASVAGFREEAASKLALSAEVRQKTAEQIREKQGEADHLTLTLREAVKEAEGAREALLEKRRAISELQEELLAFEQSMKSLRLEIDASGQAISECEVRLTELRMRLENLHSNILATYGLDISLHETEPPGEEDPQRIEELKGKMSDLGPVSLATIEEYEELTARYEFITTQKNDLEKSIAELEEAIKKINASTRKMLREAFEALREKFSIVFAELFRGGRAELVLTDEHNILETGIEIIAQPPGKKLQNINLLSGGEKSLTALSLLFASFLIKPTPLCVLDEADSALDEPNTVKFAHMLRSLSETTQFIVITHNRITMETANHLYGVTMQEPGISKVVSMRLLD